MNVKSTEKLRKPTAKQIDKLLDLCASEREHFDLFRRQVADYFLRSSRFNTGPLPLVHSVKSRLKDPGHLRDKLVRKWVDGPITPESLFTRITDLAGVRVIHLCSQQFAAIHSAISEHVAQGHWTLAEPPVAYSWDPEATDYFRSLGLDAKLRESYYTSIHYVVRPQQQSHLSCEIQVRTLFEEAWGEIDHAFNYPDKTNILSCTEQLRVLAKLASTGTRLADSIFRTAEHAGKTF